jgi:protein SCO1/2
MRQPGRIVPALLALVAFGLACPAGAVQRQEPLPKELEGVGITEKLGARLPLDLSFVDESGRTVTLASYFEKGRPVILTLNYYSCPMLCTLMLNGLIDGLRELKWTPGEEFEIVTVSINPLETPTLARLKKQTYMEYYDRPTAAAGWHFLTGREREIRQLADAVGFGYAWVESRKEYAHPAVIMLASADGRIVRYLYGVMYEPKDLRLAIAEAGEGKVGSTAEQILLYCFHYDADEGRYVVAASNLMRAGGLATALILGSWLLVWWRRTARRRGNAGDAGGARSKVSERER